MGGNLYSVNVKSLKVSLERKLGDAFLEARIFNGSSDELWLVNRSAAYRYSTRSKEIKYILGVDKNHPPVDGRLSVMYAYTDPNRRTWLGTYERGLYYYNDSTSSATFFSKSTPFIVSIAADVNYRENNLLWVGGGYSGLNVLNTKNPSVV